MNSRPGKTGRVAVFGDSIAAGMGARGRSFPVLVSEALGAELIDFSGTAHRIGEGVAEYIGMARGDDLVLVAHGATEALLRPIDASLRLVPRRWRRPGWLDPRPYFSSRRRRRLIQRMESGLRWRVKILLLRAFGSTQWLSPQLYEEKLAELVEQLDPSRVFILGTLPIDERYFPGSPAEVRKYSEIGRKVAMATGATFIDISETCDRWSDFCTDHFHPNGSGHRQIAERVLASL